MTFTPGSWHTGMGSRTMNVFDPDGVIVAMVSALSVDPNADANLIAAAPELLDVVRELTVRFHNNYDPEPRAQDIANLIPMAHAAIAKAEGRES